MPKLTIKKRPNAKHAGLSGSDYRYLFEHIQKSDTSWQRHFADHGLKPKAVERAMASFFDLGEGRLQAAISAFSFGLAFGAMRLQPFPIADNEEAGPCDCPFCQLRRQVEGQEGEGGDPI